MTDPQGRTREALLSRWRAGDGIGDLMRDYRLGTRALVDELIAAARAEAFEEAEADRFVPEPMMGGQLMAGRAQTNTCPTCGEPVTSTSDRAMTCSNGAHLAQFHSCLEQAAQRAQTNHSEAPKSSQAGGLVLSCGREFVGHRSHEPVVCQRLAGHDGICAEYDYEEG